ncbi:ParB/RepB/Spo0J family partition protein [Azospirillum doebereinerae]|uniref:ParB/RepB/Spo0J family partition protein n=1 Tax=Azospirillum doebereinerae TaxID=92933 RepID=UPI001EE5D6BD|nr:ParB/RepB/Spo0J family partition protein [Azospirillum doebereinerae]MCG5238387.1 ParB/RepB/Spo0J family partition protein [Azospirillum doebereinerae]
MARTEDATSPIEGNAAGNVELIHIKACFPSPLNPRKTFPEDAIREMADSIAASGLLQPLTGRLYTEMLENVPSAREIFMGGRRLRALDLLFESGPWPHDHLPDYMVPVIRRDVDDLTLLRLALAENINRADMHPLEEGEALALFRRAGQSLQEVADQFGKTPRWVQQRIQVAEGLDPESRKLFAGGTINMEAARELVRLPEESRRGHVAAIMMGDKNYRSAADIRDRIAEGLPEVKTALFDLKLYTGEFERAGRFQHDQKERFSDVAQFRKLQEEAIDARIATLEKSWFFVKVLREKKKPDYFHASDYLNAHKLARTYEKADKAKHGVLVVVFPDLSVEQIEGVTKGVDAPPPSKEQMKAAGDVVASISAGRRTYAHQRKSVAFQMAMLRKGRRAATEMTVMALLGDGTAIGLRPENRGPDNRCMAPELVKHLRRWHFEAFTGTDLEPYEPNGKGTSAYVEFKPGYYSSNGKPRLKLFEIIGTLSDEDLDELFTLLVTARCGSFADFQSSFGNPDLTIAMAERYGVTMEGDWQIDDAYLATMTRDQLHALAHKINSWCGLRDLATLEIKELQAMKVGEMRKAMAAHVRANDVRLVPPELRFRSQKMIEADLRSFGEGGKVGKQTDLTEMIDKVTKGVAETPVADAAPASVNVVRCPIELPMSLAMRLDRTVSQFYERIVTTATLRLADGEFAVIQRKNGLLEIALHHAPDKGVPSGFFTFRGSMMLAKKLAAFLRKWLDAAEVDLNVDQLIKANLIRFDGATPQPPEPPPPVAGVVRWANRANEGAEVAELLNAVGVALPLHPDFGQREIILKAPDHPHQLLLDAAHNRDGDYWIISASGSGSPAQDAANVLSTLRAWLATMTTAEDDAAIDELFDDAPAQGAAA